MEVPAGPVTWTPRSVASWNIEIEQPFIGVESPAETIAAPFWVASITTEPDAAFLIDAARCHTFVRSVAGSRAMTWTRAIRVVSGGTVNRQITAGVLSVVTRLLP